MISKLVYKAGKDLDTLIAQALDLPPARYSESPTKAFKAWQAFVHRGRWCCTKITSDYDYVWGIKLTPGHGNKLDPEFHEVLISMESSKGFAIVACNAIMAALQWERDIDAR